MLCHQPHVVVVVVLQHMTREQLSLFSSRTTNRAQPL
jgi:hypothetical protein